MECEVLSISPAFPINILDTCRSCVQDYHCKKIYYYNDFVGFVLFFIRFTFLFDLVNTSLARLLCSCYSYNTLYSLCCC